MGKGKSFIAPKVPYCQIEEPCTDYLLLPSYRRFNLRRQLLLGFCLGISLAALAVVVFWPSDPDLHVVRIHLDRFRVSPLKPPSLDISINVTIKVHNRDFFSLDYDSLVATVGYRGRHLGSLKSEGGHIRARRTSYVDAMLRIDGIKVMEDAVYLIDDLTRGLIPFDTVTQIRGSLGMFFFDVPIQGRVSCSVIVNAHNQEIFSKDCYPQ